MVEAMARSMNGAQPVIAGREGCPIVDLLICLRHALPGLRVDVDRVEQGSVGVVLALLVGGVPNADGAGPLVAVQVVQRSLGDLALARADGRYRKLMAAWAKVAVLIIDDLALRPLTAEQAADLLEVIEDRYQLRSTIVTSQLPVSEWHSSLGEPTIADAILDRLIHNAHRIELRGDSLRRLQEPALAATSDLEKRRDEPETAQKRGRREKRAATMPQDAR